MRTTELKDEQWQRPKPLLPHRKGKGLPRTDNLGTLNGLLCRRWLLPTKREGPHRKTERGKGTTKLCWLSAPTAELSVFVLWTPAAARSSSPAARLRRRE